MPSLILIGKTILDVRWAIFFVTDMDCVETAVTMLIFEGIRRSRR